MVPLGIMEPTVKYHPRDVETLTEASESWSRTRIHGPRLGTKTHKGGISRLAPRKLAPSLQSLPPILHM